MRVLGCDPSLDLQVDPTINTNTPKLLRFKELLLASGVNKHADSVSFQPIDPVADARINQLNMMPGFVPVVPNLNLGEECKLGGGSRETCFNMGERATIMFVHLLWLQRQQIIRFVLGMSLKL